MAQQKMRWTFNIKDSEGVRSTCTFHGTYTDTTTVAVLATELAAMKVLVSKLTDGTITACEATMVLAGADQPANFADSDVSQVALFDFPNSAGRLNGIAIPAFADDKIANAHITLGDTDVAAWISAMTLGGSDFTPTDRNWLATGGLDSAFLGDRKHRRALKRSSYEIPSS